MTLEAIGIDFGTSTTLVSVREASKSVRVVEIGRGTRNLNLIPSQVALFPQNGKPVLLAGAKAVGYTEASVGHFRSLKRHIWCRSNCLNAGLNGTWCKGGELHFQKWRLPLTAVISQIIGEALRLASEATGLFDCNANGAQLPAVKLPDSVSVVMGCPAEAGLAERKLLMDSARAIGIKNLSLKGLVEEQILAAKMLRVLEGFRSGRHLIVDIGGGSTDVAVIDLNQEYGHISVLATSGYRFAGGDDVDAKLLDIALEKASAEDKSKKSAALWEQLNDVDRFLVRERVEQAKIELGYVPEVPLDVAGLHITLTQGDLKRALGASNLTYKLDDAVDRVCRRLIRRIGERQYPQGTIPIPGDLYGAKTAEGRLVDHLGKLDRKRLLEEIDSVVLVGGSSEMPLIREWADARFGPGRIISPSLLSPVEAVVRGAASPIEIKQEHLGRSPFRVIGEQHDGSRITLFDAYEDLAVSQPAPVARIPDGVERILIEDATSGELLHLASPEGIRLIHEVRVDVFGNLVVTGNGRKGIAQGEIPWKTPAQKQFEELYSQYLKRVEEEKRERVRFNTDPHRSLREDVG